MLATADVWWIDTDVVCLSADWPDPIAPVCAGWEDEEKVGNAVLWTAPAFAEKLDQHAAGLGKGILWGQSGPDLLTEMLRSADLLAGMLPTNVFYPIHYDEWAKVFQPEFAAYVRDATQASCALHLWNEMLRRAQVDKTLAPNAESFFGSVVQRHQTGRYFETSRRTNPANGRSRGWRDIFSLSLLRTQGRNPGRPSPLALPEHQAKLRWRSPMLSTILIIILILL